MENDYKAAITAASEAGRIRNTITEAAAQETQETPKTQKTQKKRKPGRPRKYEAPDGVPRINLALTEDLYDYVKTMARARGESMTDLLNSIIEKSMQDNAKTYKQAKSFLKSL